MAQSVTPDPKFLD